MTSSDLSRYQPINVQLKSCSFRRMTSKPPSDPIFRTLQGIQTSSSGEVNNATTISLLQAAFPPPGVAQQLYAQKLEHRPLSLNPADAPNARESRRQKRL